MRYVVKTQPDRAQLQLLAMMLTPWTTAQADEAESLVAKIRAESIVARNGEGESDAMTDDDARRAMR